MSTRTRTMSNNALDMSVIQIESGYGQILSFPIIRPFLRKVSRCIVDRAFERGIINSHSYHEMREMVDRIFQKASK